ncbi:MAG: 6-bladed beta-propeller [Candidatus Tectomicrobia bacterium]|uniref:6-bladed beta-propeller n=1 Tax=Tectimicrobiota bacterium TaxID=2528274 RepID=A0A937W1G7_UNCTE|nr:6-bladed beta-propeller [Candidatus Tectomicrobia bacterium]
MLTQMAAGRVFDFSHAVGRGALSGMGFRLAVALAVGNGDTIYAANRGWEQVTNVPWNKTQLGTRIGKLTVGPVPGDEEVVGDFSKPGDAPGELIWPAGLALDSQENVYVTDEWLNRVSVFDKDGTFLRHWGKAGSGTGEFNGPSGLAIDAEDMLFITDSRNHRIQRYTPDGTCLTTWGGFGSAPGQFHAPWGLAVDHDGYVYVADHKNHRVQKFTADGAFVMQFGSYGTGKGQLNRPAAVAVDPDGDVYVCDWANHRVQVFGSDGTFVMSLLGDAQELSKWAKMTLAASPDSMRRRREVRTLEQEWRMAFPTAVVFDPKYDRLIISDTQRNRLQIYNKLKSYTTAARTI